MAEVVLLQVEIFAERFGVLLERSRAFAVERYLAISQGSWDRFLADSFMTFFVR